VIVEVAGRGAVLGKRIATARTFHARLRGLLGRRDLRAGEGLWIERCNAIHMFFMRFPIDVAFLARDGTVVKLLHGIRPWRMSGLYLRARDALELPEGTLKCHAVRVGEQLTRR